MRRLVLFAVMVTSLASAGCGSGLVRLTGELRDNGQPVRLGEGESVQIDFVTADKSYPPLNLGVYVKPDGRFAVDMNDGTGGGLPPGQYKVKFNGEGTTIKRKVHAKLMKDAHLVTVTKGASLHLVIDLATGVSTP